MGLYLFVSKAINNLCWCRELYLNQSVTPYVSNESALLHAGLLLELRGCWLKVFRCLGLNECSSECLKPATQILNEVPVYGWLSAEASLKSLARVTSITYSRIQNRLLDFIKTDLGVKPSVDIYAGLTYAPNLREPRTISLDSESNSLYLCILTPPSATPQGVTDLVVAEVLKQKIRKSLTPLPPTLFKGIVDALAPSGELSRELGLTQVTKLCASKVCDVIKEYFRSKKKVKEGLIPYLLKKLMRGSSNCCRTNP